MAHCTKFVRAATGGMFIHYDRTAEHKLSNQDIDHERTHLNYNLAFNDQPLNQSVFLKKRLSEITTNGRKTQNVMCDWIVTLPVEVKSEDEERFFKETYDFLSEKYGRENVISAYVHKDETTPHLHFSWVPVEKTEQGEKLNAKAIINRNTLRTFHREYSQCINERLGYECGVVNGIVRENGKNKTIAELKTENQANIKAIDASLTSIRAISEELDKIPLAEPETVLKRSLVGSKLKKTLSIDEWETLQAIREELETDRSALNQALDHVRSALIKEKNIIEELTATPLAKQNRELKKELISVKEELLETRNELNAYQQFIDRFHLEELFAFFKQLFEKIKGLWGHESIRAEVDLTKFCSSNELVSRNTMDQVEILLEEKESQLYNVCQFLREQNWSEEEILFVLNRDQFMDLEQENQEMQIG